MKANINRVVSRLEDIYQCGKKEDGTYTRMAFSEEDVKGRELFASWAKRLGMTCHVDEAGNLIAHMDGQDNDLPAIMMGSHLEKDFWEAVHFVDRTLMSVMMSWIFTVSHEAK